MFVIVLAVLFQQAAAGQVVWETPGLGEPVEAAAPVDIPAIPDSARADPYGYERAECSPLVRKTEESMESCQQRVRVALAANLGAALPAGLTPASGADNCRQEAAGDRYALQCGSPTRTDRPAAVLEERICETRPRLQPRGGVAWTEDCQPASGRRDEGDGLKIRLGGRD